MATGNINLIDPNEIISEYPPYVNGTPAYEKMFYFVELTAYRKGRTVLRTTNTGVTQERTDLEKDVAISMMGYDQSSNDTQHTTRYTFNTSVSENNYEGFGITNIKIVTNSSFVPTVNVEFLDLRGNSFAQGKNSIYNILFDFPPPLYKLTIKGYYGKALSYDLHLVKYNTRFEASEGNYVINAEFVARTFAPLTDVLFKYIQVFPFIDIGTGSDGVNLNPGGDTLSDRVDAPTQISADPRIKAKNTYELIKILESLYDKIAVAKNSSVEAEALEKELSRKNSIQSFYDNLGNFKDRYEVDPTIKDTGNFFEVNKILSDNISNVNTITLKEYNTYLKSTQQETVGNEEKKLFLAFPTGALNENNAFQRDLNKTTTIAKELKRLRKGIIDDATDINKNLFVYSPQNQVILPTENPDTTYNGRYFTDESTNIEYLGIDITPLYVEVFRTWTTTVDSVNDKEKKLIGRINQVAEEELGTKPTIYQIFKIICDDVDKYFQKIKDTSIAAEIHHNKDTNKSLIISDNKIKESKDKNSNRISAFPLFISGETICNVKRQSRRMPTAENIGQPDMEEFPEAVLVEKFMDAIIRLEKEDRIYNLKSQENVDGSNVWIPSTAADSTLYDELSTQSPYLDIFGGGNSINTIFNIFLNRFYTQSQFTYGYDFFGNTEEGVFAEQNKLVQFLAKSEAANLAQSLTEENIINKLLNQVPQFQKNINLFYTYLSGESISNYTTISSNYLTLDNGVNVYRDRANTDYVGIKLLIDEEDTRKVALRAGQTVVTEKTASPVDDLLSSNEGRTIGEAIFAFFGFREDKNEVSQFVNENIPYFPDVDVDTEFTSLYLMNYSDPRFESYSTQTTKFNNVLESGSPTATIITECSNITENIIDYIVTSKKGDSGAFIDIWSDLLARHSDLIYDFLQPTSPYDDDDEIIQDVVVVSNLLRTVGYFNTFSQVNNIMKYPAVTATPYYAPLYMGGLVKISKSSTLKTKLINFLNSELGQAIRTRDYFTSPLGATYILYDLDKISLLSENDQEIFETAFDEYHELYARDWKNNMISMIDLVTNDFQGVETSWWDYITLNSLQRQVTKKYAELMESGGSYKALTNDLTRTVYMLNLSQFTFNRGGNAVPTTYTPLSQLKDDTTKTNRLNIYFQAFFIQLEQSLKKVKKDLKELDDKFTSVVRDNDIKTQTYYSFKNVSDKWVAGESNRKIYGFPYNTSLTDRLINKFAFVDRAMNPIGDSVIINAESLIEMSKDFDISVFTVLSRLLSQNGFEFFPLQNFMSYTENEWGKDAFKIIESATNDQLSTPSFVCMYLGGTSNFLKNDNSEYDDDGLDLNNMSDATDFTSTGCTDQPEVKDKKPINSQGRKYPYSEVRAFRVRYAEQNQSVFTKVEIDSREYQETNESLAILSKIAQDESTASPVPKGQNLYSTYESRAYSATVDMFGNAMIQPTQYFQLENVPIFSGAYVILSVEHNIIPEKMTTKFSGMKVLKFPNPFVTEFATLIGKNDGTSTDISGNNADYPPQNNTYGNRGAETLPAATHYNAIYDLPMKP